MKEGWRGNRGRRWGLTSVDCGKAPKLAKRHNGKGEPEAAPKMLSKKTGLWSLPICHWRPASQQPSSSSISSYRFTSADEISTNRRGSRLSGARHMQHKAISPRPFSPERPVPNPKKKDESRLKGACGQSWLRMPTRRRMRTPLLCPVVDNPRLG